MEKGAMSFFLLFYCFLQFANNYVHKSLYVCISVSTSTHTNGGCFYSVFIGRYSHEVSTKYLLQLLSYMVTANKWKFLSQEYLNILNLPSGHLKEREISPVWEISSSLKIAIFLY